MYASELQWGASFIFFSIFHHMATFKVGGIKNNIMEQNWIFGVDCNNYNREKKSLFENKGCK